MNAEFLKKTWLTHAVIWSSYFILLVWFYSETRTFEPTVLKSVFIILIQAGVFYLNLYILLPRYFEKKKYSNYFLFTLVILIISLILFYFFDQLSFRLDYQHAVRRNDFSQMPRGWRQGMHHRGPPPYLSNPFMVQFIWRQVLFHGFFVVIVLFISTIYRNIVITGKKEKESLELRSRVTEAESNMLKSQINPHFLFNTLNNIYSMAQLKSDKTPDAIHRLSEMLRYVIYDCYENLVPLKKEASYLKGYIELQLMKEEGMDNVSYQIGPFGKNLMIAPMILIPFIENSFKHSMIEDTERSWIKIGVQSAGKILTLNVDNSIPAVGTKRDHLSGIGLDNVKKRLQLLYPEKHTLKIVQNENEFKVELRLDLDES